jgi:hypothetical protein
MRQLPGPNATGFSETGRSGTASARSQESPQKGAPTGAQANIELAINPTTTASTKMANQGATFRKSRNIVDVPWFFSTIHSPRIWPGIQ